MSQTANQVQWTIHDLDTLPQNEGTSYEIINGDLYMTRSPHYQHQQVIGRIFGELDRWSESTGWGEAIPFPSLLLSATDVVIPDLVWVSKGRLPTLEDEAGHLTAAPDLVVEVLSPGEDNRKRDRETKLKLYSVYGAGEYWIVDRFVQQVEVYQRDHAQLALAKTLIPGDLLVTPSLPEFAGVVDRFFP